MGRTSPKVKKNASFDDPSEMEGGVGLAADERRIVEVSRELGLDRAARLLEYANDLGYELALDRLLLRNTGPK